MLEQFNILVSTSRGNERNACSELWYLLRELGDRRAEIEATGIIGLVIAQTELDPIDALEGLHKKLIESPWKFRYILKVTPIQRVVSSDVTKVADGVTELSKSIRPGESFKITVEKRHTSLSSREVIKIVADRVERRVNLDNPDKIVLIQIIGDLTGISIIRPSDVLSVEREKRSI